MGLWLPYEEFYFSPEVTYGDIDPWGVLVRPANEKEIEKFVKKNFEEIKKFFFY